MLERKGKDLPQKVKYLREIAGIRSTTEFMVQYHLDTGKSEGTARNYATNEKDIHLKTDGPEVFVKFWNQDKFKEKGISFEDKDLYCTYDEFLARRGEAPDDGGFTPTFHSSDDELHRHFSDLVGTYQIIRPHALHTGFYVLEALGIELKDGRLVNTSYSHQEPTADNMYTGSVELGQRYYCSLLKRKGSHGPAYRCYTFFIGGGKRRYKACLSGIMLRGMSGDEISDEKQAVALPFIAIRTSTTLTLDKPDIAALNKPEDDADPLHLLHKQGDIFLGIIPEHWYPGVFGYCRKVFTDPAFVEASRQHDVGLRTATSSVLKNMPNLTLRRWVEVSTDLKKALGKGICFPETP